MWFGLGPCVIVRVPRGEFPMFVMGFFSFGSVRAFCGGGVFSEN